MTAASLVCNAMFTVGGRPLARDHATRRTVEKTRMPRMSFGLIRTSSSPASQASPALRLRSAASSPCSSPFTPKTRFVGRLAYTRSFRSAVVASGSASEDGTDAVTGDEVGGASEVSSASSASTPPPEEDSAPGAENDDDDEMSFAQLGLPKALCAALEAAGIKDPSPPQVATIPLLLEGRNVAMQSHTGSGKTLAYLLPVLKRILDDSQKPPGERNNDVQCVVVVPSQELAMQIVRQVERVLGDFGRQITQQCIGGANVRRQEEGIRKKKPLVVVGTPGRLAELSRSGILRTHQVRCLVVDEADDLLASNFRRDMARICDHTGKGVLGGRQTVIVSATLRRETLDQYSYMAPNMKHVISGRAVEAASSVAAAKAAREAAKNGVGIEYDKSDGDDEDNEEDGFSFGDEDDDDGALAAAMTNASLPPNLEHYSVVATRGRKVDRLRKAIHATGAERALVFLNFGHRLSDTRDKLATRGMECGVLHGGMNKHERSSELAKFRRGEFRALLVSDLAARGIDVPEVDAVFNMELPTDETHYVHRAGRTGRMGADGVVMSIAEPSEAFVLSRIGKRLGIRIHAADLQNGRVVPDRGNTPTPRKEHLEGGGGGRGSGGGGRGRAGSERGLGERSGGRQSRGRGGGGGGAPMGGRRGSGRGGRDGRGGGAGANQRRGYDQRQYDSDYYDDEYDRSGPARGRGGGGGGGGGGGYYTPKGQPRRRQRKTAGGAGA